MAGRLPLSNLFGEGSTNGISSVDSINYNSIKYASVSYGTENIPFDYCMILTFVNGGYGMQIAISVDQNKMAYRGRVAYNWNDWAYV